MKSSLWKWWKMRHKQRRINKLGDNLDIAVLDLDGVIAASTDEKSNYRYIMESLFELAEIRPRSLILRINSPGGTTGASEELYRTVLALKRECGTKVVVLMEDVCASGGLYVAMAGDKILSKAGTITGSIGVIIQGFEYKDVLDLLKVKVRTIKSGRFKDILSPTRAMEPGEAELISEMIQDVYGQFCQVVANSRKLSIETVRSFADGRVMTGSQALKFGLVDQIGGYTDAILECRRLLKIAKNKEHELEVWTGPEEGLLSKLGLSSQLSALNSIALNAKLSGMPLWMMPR